MRLVAVLSLLWMLEAPIDARAEPAEVDSSWMDAEPPADPFAHDYALPKEREVGSAAGQFRIIGSALLAVRGEAPEFGLHGTLELMTFAYLGVRGSLQTTLVGPDAQPRLFAAKTGPSLHILPYRWVDLSLFVEGGIGVVDPTRSTSTPLALLSPGGTFEVWLYYGAFLRTEAHLDWGVYNRDGVANHYRRIACLLGLGIAL